LMLGLQPAAWQPEGFGVGDVLDVHRPGRRLRGRTNWA
jgi:hypothetical protein